MKNDTLKMVKSNSTDEDYKHIMSNFWISVKERLPESYEEVMFFYVMYGYHLYTKEREMVKRDIVCGHQVKGVWHICYLYVSMPLREDTDLEVTHWMPLPEYPL